MASLCILPTLTAGRRLGFILELLAPSLRAELLQKLKLGFLQSSVNCHAMSVTLFVLALLTFTPLIDSMDIQMEGITEKLIS